MGQTKFKMTSICAFIFSASCAMTVMSESEINQIVEAKAIHKCIDEYERLSGENFQRSPIDRVYAFSFNQHLDLLFTIGSMGLFEDTSQNYKLVYTCGLAGVRYDEIFIVGRPLKAPFLIDEEKATAFAWSEDDMVGISLYLRKDNDFEFRDKMTSRLGDIDISNSHENSDLNIVH